jgi:hypothetical protein
MANLPNAREWWQRRMQDRQDRQQAGQEAQIPVLDLRNSEWATQSGQPAQWPTADVLDQEEEAQYASGVSNIELDFQTRTINPPRPRTVAAGYDPASQTLRIKFRPGASTKSPGGAVYDYFDVTEKEYWAVQHAISTGRFINNQLDAKDYVRRA